MKNDLYDRGAKSRNARLAETTKRQQQEQGRKNTGIGTGVIGRGNKKRDKAGMQRHVYGS
jgi:hypothetical protein